MSDGEAKRNSATSKESKQGVVSRIRANRQTPFVLFAICTGLLAVSLVALHALGHIDLQFDVRLRVGLSLAVVLTLMTLFLLFRDTGDNFAHGPKAMLPSLCLTLLAGLTLGVVTLNETSSLDVAVYSIFSHNEILFYIYLCLFSALLPLGFNAALLSHLKDRARSQNATMLDNDQTAIDADREDAEAMGALLATLAVAALSILATSAAKWGEGLQLQALYGVALSAFVVGIFGVVIFLEPLSQLRFVRGLSRALKWVSRKARFLATFYGALDQFLVRIGAVMVGMEHRNMWSRYAVLAVTMACLSTLGWLFPPPHGLIPSFIALILALAVSRLWSWVEDDRALAALTSFNQSAPYRTEMREDYRDETLLGFVFVFGLMPIIMYQLHHSPIFESIGGVFKVPKNQAHSFVDWLGFFGIELAKAIPIVDWAEIYNIGQPGEDPIISMKGSLSQHAVFLARITVDLVLIAALLQAIGISSRNRQQKRLYNAGADPSKRHHPGLIDRLDPFVERAELRRAIVETTRKGAPSPEFETTGAFARAKIFDLLQLTHPDLIDFRRYNTDRLQEIYHKSSDPRQRAFIAAIEHERPDFSLKTRIQLLEDLSEHGRDESALYNVQSKLIDDYRLRPDDTALTVHGLRNVLLNTKERSGLKAFKLKTIKLLGDVALNGANEDVEQAIGFLVDIAGRSDADAYQYTRAAAVVRTADVAIENGDERLLRFAQQEIIELKSASPQPMTLHAISGALDRIDRELEKRFSEWNQ